MAGLGEKLAKVKLKNQLDKLQPSLKVTPTGPEPEAPNPKRAAQFDTAFGKPYPMATRRRGQSR